MEDKYPGESLLAWALATFQTSIFLLFFVVLLFLLDALGNVLSALNTSLGLLLFLLLWATSAYCTLRAVRDLKLSERPTLSMGQLLTASVYWGSINGMVFVGLPLILGASALILLTVASGSIEALPAVLVFGLIAIGFGLMIAGAVGCVAGFAFGVIEGGAYLLARRLTATVPATSESSGLTRR